MQVRLTKDNELRVIRWRDGTSPGPGGLRLGVGTFVNMALSKGMDALGAPPTEAQIHQAEEAIIDEVVSGRGIQFGDPETKPCEGAQ